jgi:predicted dienelactone hydrolase
MTFERVPGGSDPPRTLHTWIWYPSRDGSVDTPARDALPADGPFPVVVFSHGSGGQPDFQQFFTRHLASWGFIVAAPPHPGNTSSECVICSFDVIIESARNRPDDVTFILDRMLELAGAPEELLGAAIDPERAALAGHSFGGWTAIYTEDARFDALVSFAPGLPETLLVRATKIAVPVLIVAGGEDEVVPAGSVQKLYEALPADLDKTYISLPRGRHTAFVDVCFTCNEGLSEERGHELINRYATAFLLWRLGGDARYAAFLEEPLPPDAVVIE